jgi:PAS domain S-box-containing protein
MQKTDEIINVLIIEDDEDDVLITGNLIKKITDYRFNISWCSNYEDALQKIDEGNFHICFVDYYLGIHTGLDLIHTACLKHGQLPLILLTGNGNQHLGMQAMKAGAMDYLVKNELDKESIDRSVRYVLERNRALKALSSNEKKFRMVFEKSNDAILLTTPNFTIINCNPATQELLSTNKNELIQKSLSDFINENDLQHIKEALEQNGVVEDIELLVRSNQNEIRHGLFSATLQEDKEDAYYQCVIHDISLLRKAEQQKFRIQKREMIDRMVQALAHEVRNPLNNINLSLEQIPSATDDKERSVYVEIIQRNSERIQNLISDLLLSSRTAQLNKQSFVLQDLIHAIVTNASDRMVLKKITCEISLPETPLLLKGDAQKLKIALMNIINNAIEAMQENGTLSIKLEKQKEHLTVLVIKDTGCGIPENEISKLFDPYHTTKKNGMGLGLATTINILHAHQVDIEVDSVVNVGTTFTLFFSEETEA